MVSGQMRILFARFPAHGGSFRARRQVHCASKILGIQRSPGAPTERRLSSADSNFNASLNEEFVSFTESPLEKLAEKSLGRNRNGTGDAKAVGLLIRKIHHDLKSMVRLGLCLKVAERGRKIGFADLDFHQEPGLAVTNYEEVYLAFLFVAQITQLEIAESQVRPALHGLEQMASDKGFRPRAVACQAAPIPLKPFRFLAQGFGDICKPWTNEEAMV